MNENDLVGQKFGKLTVVSFYGSHNRKLKWECLCDCENTCLVTTYKLKTGHTKSCGCYSREAAKDRLKTHGLSKHPIFYIYHHMIDRCYNKNSSAYKHYGGRGIYIVDRWLNSETGIQNFIEDMSPRPEGTTIDRIDNNGPYSPENCKWSTLKEQSRNKRYNIVLTFDGRTQCVTDWANEFGISANCIKYRLSKGRSVEYAITRPSERPRP